MLSIISHSYFITYIFSLLNYINTTKKAHRLIKIISLLPWFSFIKMMVKAEASQCSLVIAIAATTAARGRTAVTIATATIAAPTTAVITTATKGNHSALA